MAFAGPRVQLLILCTFVNVRDEIDSDLESAQCQTIQKGEDERTFRTPDTLAGESDLFHILFHN